MCKSKVGFHKNINKSESTNGQGSDEKQCVKNKKFAKRGAKQINECHEDEAYNANCTHHHSASEQLDHSFDTSSFSELSISKLSLADNKCNKAFVTLHVKLQRFPGTHNFKLKVDTGAQANTMPLRVFQSMFPSCLISNGYPNSDFMNGAESVKLYAYNNTPIKCHGRVCIACRFRDSSWPNTEFTL